MVGEGMRGRRVSFDGVRGNEGGGGAAEAWCGVERTWVEGRDLVFGADLLVWARFLVERAGALSLVCTGAWAMAVEVAELGCSSLG